MEFAKHLLAPAICLLFSSASAQIFSNLDFEATCPQSATGFCRWDKSWGGKDAIRVYGETGARSMLIDVQKGVGFAEQTAEITGDPGLRVISVSGKIRTENVEGKGAGLNIAILDNSGQLLFNKDMGYGTFNWVSGSRDWREYTLSAVCAPEATHIRIGAILYGSGKAWFDDFAVTIRSAKNSRPSRLARSYLSAAVDTIAIHSLRKDSADLKTLKKNALRIAGPAKKPADCHLAVTWLLQSLGDHHSFFMTPEEVKGWEGGDEDPAEVVFPTSRIIDGCGYVNVPHFHGGDPKSIQAYADSLQTLLRNLDRADIKGWIIDLRQNTGGNMEPMIAGLGPLFDSEKLGYLFDVNGGKEYWAYKNGAYYWENEKLTAPTLPVRLQHRRPIAVLIGPQTGSSGEIAAISFIGNGNTRLFGQPTWGLTTGNGAFDLPDGARMMLASTIMADRNEKRYYGPVEPDERVENVDLKLPTSNSGDAGIGAAVKWIFGKN